MRAAEAIERVLVHLRDARGRDDRALRVRVVRTVQRGHHLPRVLVALLHALELERLGDALLRDLDLFLVVFARLHDALEAAHHDVEIDVDAVGVARRGVVGREASDLDAGAREHVGRLGAFQLLQAHVADAAEHARRPRCDRRVIRRRRGARVLEDQLRGRERHRVYGQQHDVHAIAEREALRLGQTLELGGDLDRALRLARVDRRLRDRRVAGRSATRFELHRRARVAFEAGLVRLDDDDRRLVPVEVLLDGARDRSVVELLDLVELVKDVLVGRLEVDLLRELHEVADLHRARAEILEPLDEGRLLAVLFLFELLVIVLVPALVRLLRGALGKVECFVHPIETPELDLDPVDRCELTAEAGEADVVREVVLRAVLRDATRRRVDAVLRCLEPMITLGRSTSAWISIVLWGAVNGVTAARACAVRLGMLPNHFLIDSTVLS